jgi:glycine/D-amino acid oxidase-like deaminating enzyme
VRSRASRRSYSAPRRALLTAGAASSVGRPTGYRSSAKFPATTRWWVAAGYSGHGNVLGLACGELVAQAILGSPAPELAIFEPARLL